MPVSLWRHAAAAHWSSALAAAGLIALAPMGQRCGCGWSERRRSGWARGQQRHWQRSRRGGATSHACGQCGSRGGAGSHTSDTFRTALLQSAPFTAGVARDNRYDLQCWLLQCKALITSGLLPIPLQSAPCGPCALRKCTKASPRQSQTSRFPCNHGISPLEVYESLTAPESNFTASRALGCVLGRGSLERHL